MLLFVVVNVNCQYLADLQPGVYGEKISQVFVTGHKAEVWIKFGVKSFRNELQQLDQLSQEICDVCKKKITNNQSETCDSFLRMSSAAIKHSEENFKSMTNGMFSGGKKSRRDLSSSGLFNFVGHFQKWAWGTMDSTDSAYINQKLELFKEQQANNFVVQHQYTAVLDKTISRLQDTNAQINRHSETLNSIMDQIKFIENFSSNAPSFEFLQLSEKFLLLSRFLDEKINGVTQMLTDLNNGILSTRYLSYQELLKSFEVIKINDTSMCWPLDFKNADLLVFKKLSKFAVFEEQNSFIIVFSLPFVECQQFQMQKFYAVPTIKNEIGAFVEISNDFVISSTSFEKFTTLSMLEREKNCVKIRNFFYCSDLHLMSTNEKSCLGNIILADHRNISDYCKVNLIPIREPIVLKTESSNTYLCFTASAITGQLFINNVRENIIFQGTQLLSINKMALLTVATTEIKFFPNNVRYTFTISLSSKFEIDQSILSFPTLSQCFPKQPVKKTVILPTHLNELSVDINEIRKTISRSEDLKAEATESLWHKVLTFICTAALIVFILVSLYYVIKYWNFCSITQSTVADLGLKVASLL